MRWPPGCHYIVTSYSLTGPTLRHIPRGCGIAANTSVTVTDAAGGSQGGGDYTFSVSKNFAAAGVFTGDCTITATLTDGDAPPVSAVATATFASPPAAVDKSYTVGEDAPLIVPAAEGLLTQAGAIGVDAAALVAAVTSGPTHGTLALAANGSFTYTPATDYNGADSFTFTVAASAGGLSGTAVVSITVTAVNDEPQIIAPPTYTTSGGTNLTLPAPGLLLTASDVDSNATLAAVAGTFDTENGGVVVITSDGGFTYEPNADFAGSDHFNYTITDTLASTTGVATVTVSECGKSVSQGNSVNKGRRTRC